MDRWKQGIVAPQAAATELLEASMAQWLYLVLHTVAKRCALLDGTDKLSRKVGKKLPLLAAQ
jgi:hypothetical protein